MKIKIVSLFPEMFMGPFGASMIKRAQEAHLFSIDVINPRDFTEDKHHIVDDYPFGGGSGMVLKPEPMYRAVEFIKNQSQTEKRRIILTCPSGQTFHQNKAKELAQYEELVFLCGHYEGFDERIRLLSDEALSIGDYVLTGGELAAMVMVDAVARMIPGVLGASDGAAHDSFYEGLLEYPQYTRPRIFHDLEVPDILLSGHHANIEKWRRKEALRRTYLCRPDLLTKAELTPLDLKMLQEIREEEGPKH